MALDNRTIQEINDLIITQIEAQINQTIPLLPKAFIRVLAKVLAGVYIILYKVAGWIFLQIFVSSASFKEVNIFGTKLTPLIEWGRLVGVGDPDPATQAVVSIDLTDVQTGNTLQSGTTWTSTINNLNYINTESISLTTSPQTIQVTCTTAGEAGNLDVGDTLSLVENIGLVAKDALISSVDTTAVDAQEEDDYRQDIINAFQLQPQGGALADYRRQALFVPGVLQTYIYTGTPASNVLVYVAGDPDVYPDRIPTSNLLIAVGEEYDRLKTTNTEFTRPVTAIIDPAGDGSYGNILPITVKTFDVDIITLDVEDPATVKSQISDALTAWFLGREPYIEGLSAPPAVNTINQSNVIGIVNDIVVANNGSFQNAILESDGTIVSNWTLQEGQLSKLGVITYDGV